MITQSCFHCRKGTDPRTLFGNKRYVELYERCVEKFGGEFNGTINELPFIMYSVEPSCRMMYFKACSDAVSKANSWKEMFDLFNQIREEARREHPNVSEYY